MDRYKDLLNYPPFFTLQPNPVQLSQQLQLWSLVIREFMQQNNKTELTIAAVVGNPPFSNPGIHRSLSPTALVTILDGMVKTQHAEYLDDIKARVRIHWRTLVEWGDLVWKAFDDAGLVGHIRTVNELISDSEWGDQPFHGIAPELMLKIGQSLQERRLGVVIVNAGRPPSDQGIKCVQPAA
jgi:ESCRT-II complex subunit VPS25